MLRVVKSKREIEDARKQLVGRKLSFVRAEAGPARFVRRLMGSKSPPAFGNDIKSWDVLRTVEYIQAEHGLRARVLDLGAWQSEVLWILARLGYRELDGIDLNPEVLTMPHSSTIRYRVGNFLQSPYPDASFDVVSATSVIEHGFDRESLLREMARLLAPRGSFIASVDYWPEKIDTSDSPLFGMDWKIFSREELSSLIETAKEFGFEAAGDLQFTAEERPVHFAGRDYTFAWFVLKRR